METKTLELGLFPLHVQLNHSCGWTGHTPSGGRGRNYGGAEKVLRVSKTKRRKLLHRLAQISDSTKKKTQFVHLENDSSDVRAPCVVGIQSIAAWRPHRAGVPPERKGCTLLLGQRPFWWAEQWAADWTLRRTGSLLHLWAASLPGSERSTALSRASVSRASVSAVFEE